MDKLYRFSPIKTQEELLKAINYVAENTTKLCQQITNQQFPISGLTIFSHYPDEFENLKNIALEMGEQVEENNGPYVKLKNPIKLPTGQLSLLRIRQPDPYRMQVGCNDFEAPDYQNLKDEFLENHPNNLRTLVRPDYEMIELYDPDFDILAYFLSTKAF